MIIMTCPQCGSDLEIQVLTCLPPINKMVCHSCGWSYEEREDVIRIPYTVKKNNVVDLGNGWSISANDTMGVTYEFLDTAGNDKYNT